MSKTIPRQDLVAARHHPGFVVGPIAVNCADADPELFFPTTSQAAAPAKKICQACDLRAACLRFALSTKQRYGVWGGLTPRERAQLGRTR